MTCCLVGVAALFPRLALIGMWLMGYGGRVFDTVLWPVLGFLFMPYTTCAYAIAVNQWGAVHGWGLALVIVGVFLDLGSHGGSASSQRHLRRRY